MDALVEFAGDEVKLQVFCSYILNEFKIFLKFECDFLSLNFSYNFRENGSNCSAGALFPVSEDSDVDC